MPTNRTTRRSHLTLPQRLTLVGAYLISLEILNGLITGDWLPQGGGRSLWFFSAIGFLFFTRLSAPFLIRPRDAVVRAGTSALLLATLDMGAIEYAKSGLGIFRWTACLAATITALIAVAAISMHGKDRSNHPQLAAWGRITYLLSGRLGRGAVVFTPPVMISILGFYQSNPAQQVWLMVSWTVLVFIQPGELLLHIVEDIRQIRAGTTSINSIGEIQRIDDPGILRIRLNAANSWKRKNIHIACLPDSQQIEVIPLFLQMQNAELIGTGLCHSTPIDLVVGAQPGHVYETEARETSVLLAELYGRTSAAELVGFVVEQSTISKIRFEVSAETSLEEGAIVVVKQDTQYVYYQIVDARTEEESFSRNPHGTQIASAAQLGLLVESQGFVKYGWLPSMNTAVFLPDSTTSLPGTGTEDSDEFEIGVVPYSRIPVHASLNDMVEYHTAILGVTGTGKTELAFDIIRRALARGIKVVCVDFTGDYRSRLSDIDPISLGLADEKCGRLDELLTDFERLGFGRERDEISNQLKQLVSDLIPEVRASVSEFLESGTSNLAIFELPEISNTKGCLRVTQYYLSAVFDWAKTHGRAKQILVVLEEAHTIIPEANTMGFEKETQTTVGKIAQIALQGRKYGVGLLLISQRTALVSKTLLSQCNTVLCFGMFDDTGLKYLANVFSSDHVSAIPNLKFLQAIAFGKAVRSERPIIFEIPFDEEKRKASAAVLNQPAKRPGETSAVADVISEEEEAPSTVADHDPDDDDMPF